MAPTKSGNNKTKSVVVDGSTAKTMKHERSIYWFRNALRLHDNPSLHQACMESRTMIPLYVIDDIKEPFRQSVGIRPGCIRVNFILEAMNEMNTKIQQLCVNLAILDII